VDAPARVREVAGRLAIQYQRALDRFPTSTSPEMPNLTQEQIVRTRSRLELLRQEALALAEDR
jgi:hypothetical protein